MDVSTQTVFLIGVSIIIYFLYKYLTAAHNHWRELGIASIDRTSIWDFIVDNYNNRFHELDNERRAKLGKIYGYYEFNRPMLMMSDPAIIKNVLVKDFAVFPSGRDLKVRGDMVGDMLISLRGDRWKRVRTIISPVFTTGKIKKVFPYITHSVKTLLRNFSSSNNEENIVDMQKFYEAFAMDVIASAAFGMKIDSHNDPKNPFVVNAKKIFSPPFPWRFALFVLSPKLMNLFGISLSEPSTVKFFRSVCFKIMEERNRMKGDKPSDLIQLMMDSSVDAALESPDDEVDLDFHSKESKNELKNINTSEKVLSSDELIANCVMFFMVSFGPISLTLTQVSYLLATNPDCQERLIKEIDETLINCKNELTYDAIQDMTYLDMVVSETLRLYPVAIRQERVADTDYILGDTGIKITKGSSVVIPTYALHRDPEFYPDPEKFDPSRFISEEKAKRDPYSYIPFGSGPRFCIGKRLALFTVKACLVYLLSQYRLKKCSSTQVPLKLRTNLHVIIKPDKVLLKVEERTDKILKQFF